MIAQDIRRIQRLGHFNKALSQLTKFIDKGKLNELEKHGLIQAFEYTYELYWNTLKDYFEGQGQTNIHGSRDAIRLACRRGLIEDGETWMDMMKRRTLTSHTYNEDVAEHIAGKIINLYFSEFLRLKTKMESLKEVF